MSPWYLLPAKEEHRPARTLPAAQTPLEIIVAATVKPKYSRIKRSTGSHLRVPGSFGCTGHSDLQTLGRNTGFPRYAIALTRKSTEIVTGLLNHVVYHPHVKNKIWTIRVLLYKNIENILYSSHYELINIYKRGFSHNFFFFPVHNILYLPYWNNKE